MKKDKAEKKAEKEEKKAAKAEKKADKKAKKAEKKAKKAEKKAAKAEQKARKAEQKARNAEAKSEAASGGKKDGGKPKKSKKKLLIVLLAVVVIAVAAVFFLRGRGGEQAEEEETEEEATPIDPPVEYVLGETSLPALPVLSESILVYLEEPEVPMAPAEEEPAEDSAGETAEEGSEEEGSEEEAAEETAAPAEESTAVTYRYEGMRDPRSMIVTYTDMLSLDDVGFIYVDEAMFKASAPDFEAEEGEAQLVKSAPEEGMMFFVGVRWDAETCAVTVDYAEGAIAQPAPPETMSLAQAMDYFNSLPPSYLGLEGESLEDYRIYSMDGVVLVDGQPCIHMSVYKVNEELGTNEIAGEYFLTSDKAHLYKRDADGNLTEMGIG